MHSRKSVQKLWTIQLAQKQYMKTEFQLMLSFGAKSYLSCSKSNRQRTWRSRSSILVVGAVTEDDEAIKDGSVLGVYEIAWSTVEAGVVNICVLASFESGEESRTSFSFGSTFSDEMPYSICLGCAWKSCGAAGSIAIDFSTHFKTPFFDCAVEGPIAM